MARCGYNDYQLQCAGGFEESIMLRWLSLACAEGPGENVGGVGDRDGARKSQTLYSLNTSAQNKD